MKAFLGAWSDGGWAGLNVQFVSIYENIESMSRVGVSRSSQGRQTLGTLSGVLGPRSTTVPHFHSTTVPHFHDTSTLPLVHTSSRFHASSHFHMPLPLQLDPDFVTLPHFLSTRFQTSLLFHTSRSSLRYSSTLPDFVTHPTSSSTRFQTSILFHTSSRSSTLPLASTSHFHFNSLPQSIPLPRFNSPLLFLT